jgi:integrase
MPRRSNGEGSVAKRPNGTWVAKLWVGGKRRHLYGKTRVEVVRKLRLLQNEVASGGQAEPTRMTVSEYLRFWVDASKPSLRASTVALYETLVRLYVSPRLGTTRVAKLQPIQLQWLYNDILGRGLKARTAEQVHRLLHKALGDAVKWRLLPQNVATHVQAPKHQPAERCIWSQDEAQRFLRSASDSDSRWSPLWLLLVGSGCRIGEALALRWTDVSRTEGSIRIERSLSHFGNKRVEGPPKSRAGVRTITLPSFALDAIERQRTSYLAWRPGSGDSGSTDPHARVFSTEGGGLPYPCDLRKRFHEACKRAGVPIMRVHDLRHVHATLAVASGVDAKTVQHRLGHSTLAMTLGVYAKATRAGDVLAARALDAVIETSPGSPPDD